MNYTYTKFLTLVMIALFFATGAIAQETGDYRSAVDGDWSADASWETFDGSDWNAATAAPDGSETITIQGDHTVSVDDDVTISGHITVEGLDTDEGGLLEITTGSLVVADGGTYQHDRDGGSIPVADWQAGSTIEFTGITGNGPGDRDQEYHNITWNNAGQASNINLGYETVTISGTIRVIDSGSARLHLTDAGSGDGQTITIEGDVIVEGGQFTSTGSGGEATYETVVMGNVEVHENANLAPSRGSGGFSTWNLHGDFTVAAGATLQNSNSEDLGGFTFVADTTGGATQKVHIGEGVSYNGAINLIVPEGSVIEVEEGSQLYTERLLRNSGGSIIANGEVIFGSGGTYEHARDGGSVPTATWAEGSTALFTGIEGSGPENASQDFYNLVLNTPDNASNNHFDMNGNTIYGDIEIISTGNARLYLTNVAFEEEREITIMGDIHMHSGAFTTNGTGNGNSLIEIHHYGDITVDDGNFSISRGSGPIVYWNMYEGSIFFNAGETQNSNARSGSAFIFSGEDITQVLDVSEDVNVQHLPFTVDSLATLDIKESNFDGMSDNIELKSGGTLATAFEAGFEDNLNSQNLSLSTEAGYILNGTVEQQTGFNLPLTVESLTIDNEAGVIHSRETTINGFLRLANGVFDNTIPFHLGPDAEIIVENGSLLVAVSNEQKPDLPKEFSLNQNYPNPFNPSTNIQFNLPKQSNVTLQVFDITGRQIAVLVDDNLNAGSHTIEWNASNLASGVYLYRISAGDFTAVRKLTILK